MEQKEEIKRVVLLYFTGTGSTAKIAHELGVSFLDMGWDVDFFRIVRGFNHKQIDFSSYDVVGVGCPTYSFRAPRLHTKILKKLPIEDSAFFLFLSCGGMPGYTNCKPYNILSRKGNLYLGHYNALGPNNLRSWRPKTISPPPTNDGFSGNERHNCQVFASRIINAYAEIVVAKTRKPEKESINPFWAIYCSLFTYGWQMRAILGRKHVLESKCTRCGLCANKICPSEAITLDSQGLPLFDESLCVGCQACVSLCPELAIFTKLCKNKYPYTLYKDYVIKDLKNLSTE